MINGFIFYLNKLILSKKKKKKALVSIYLSLPQFGITFI